MAYRELIRTTLNAIRQLTIRTGSMFDESVILCAIANGRDSDGVRYSALNI